jgi:hypothetical protein
MITCTDSENTPSNKMSRLITTPFDRNQVTEQILKYDFSRPISLASSVKLHDESILNNAIEGSMQRLAYWINEAIKMSLKEILCLYHYSFKFEEKVKNITAIYETEIKSFLLSEIVKIVKIVSTWTLLKVKIVKITS